MQSVVGLSPSLPLPLPPSLSPSISIHDSYKKTHTQCAKPRLASLALSHADSLTMSLLFLYRRSAGEDGLQEYLRSQQAKLRMPRLKFAGTGKEPYLLEVSLSTLASSLSIPRERPFPRSLPLSKYLPRPFAPTHTGSFGISGAGSTSRVSPKSPNQSLPPILHRMFVLLQPTHAVSHL